MPGYIRSRNDGDRHYINAKALVDLYQVKGKECITYVPGRMDPKKYASLIKLYPRHDGRYELPKEKKG